MNIRIEPNIHCCLIWFKLWTRHYIKLKRLKPTFYREFECYEQYFVQGYDNHSVLFIKSEFIFHTQKWFWWFVVNRWKFLLVTKNYTTDIMTYNALKPFLFVNHNNKKMYYIIMVAFQLSLLTDFHFRFLCAALRYNSQREAKRAEKGYTDLWRYNTPSAGHFGEWSSFAVPQCVRRVSFSRHSEVRWKIRTIR